MKFLNGVREAFALKLKLHLFSQKNPKNLESFIQWKQTQMINYCEATKNWAKEFF